MSLDVDDTNGHGPETITIASQLSGTYTFQVFDFDDIDLLQNTAANVKIYDDTGLIGDYDVPGATGKLWTVFSITGGIVTPINTISPADLSLFGVRSRLARLCYDSLPGGFPNPVFGYQIEKWSAEECEFHLGIISIPASRQANEMTLWRSGA